MLTKIMAGIMQCMVPAQRVVFPIAVMMAIGCAAVELGKSDKALPAVTLASSATPMTSTAGIVRQTVVANQEINPELGGDFGWLPDGRVFYGEQNGNKIDWFVYDPTNQTHRKLRTPYPNLNPKLNQFVSQNGTTIATALTVSPSGKTILYTREPENYVRPTTSGPDYFDPQQLWMAHEGATPVLVSDRFASDCGILAPSSNWLNDETLLLGFCLPYYGNESYFTLSVHGQILRYHNWVELADGRIDSLSIAALAHEEPVLAFSTYSLDGLWIMHFGRSDGNEPIEMAKALLLAKQKAIAPSWSSDDQWIYYWRQGDDYRLGRTTGSIYYPWWLERISVATSQREIILGEDVIRAVIGETAYDAPYAGYRWRLAPGERKLLLLRDTTLFLISW